jgi:hypothetical protein
LLYLSGYFCTGSTTGVWQDYAVAGNAERYDVFFFQFAGMLLAIDASAN